MRLTCIGGCGFTAEAPRGSSNLVCFACTQRGVRSPWLRSAEETDDSAPSAAEATEREED